MNEHIEYRGYKAKVCYSHEDEALVGRVIDVDALIMFSGQSISEMKVEFKAAIDSYIEECEQLGTQPERPYKGSFNVRVGCEVHRKAANKAKAWGISLNEFVRIAIEQAVDRHAQVAGSVTVAKTPIAANVDHIYTPATVPAARRMSPRPYGRSH